MIPRGLLQIAPLRTAFLSGELSVAALIENVLTRIERRLRCLPVRLADWSRSAEQ